MFLVWQRSTPEVATDPECWSRLGQDPALFFWSRMWSHKFEKMDPEPLVIFGSSKSLRGLVYACHFFSKNIAEFRLHRWYPESEQDSDSQIWKFVRPVFKKFGTGAESVTKNVTTATSAFQKGPQFKIA